MPDLTSSDDWKSKINPKHIVLFRQHKDEIEKKYNKDFYVFQKEIQEGIIKFTEIEEKYLLVRLAGWREIALLRGYESVNYDVYNSGAEYCSVKCTIKWMPSRIFQTADGIEFKDSIVFSSLADAHLGNVGTHPYNLYLITIAENRAFGRAVRNFLNISILSQDEISPNVPAVKDEAPLSILSPQDTLKNAVSKVLNIDNFEDFRKFLREENKEGRFEPDKAVSTALKKAQDFNDISVLSSMSLLAVVNSKKN